MFDPFENVYNVCLCARKIRVLVRKRCLECNQSIQSTSLLYIMIYLIYCKGMGISHNYKKLNYLFSAVFYCCRELHLRRKYNVDILLKNIVL
jgi:hypothetical protein